MSGPQRPLDQMKSTLPSFRNDSVWCPTCLFHKLDELSIFISAFNRSEEKSGDTKDLV